VASCVQKRPRAMVSLTTGEENVTFPQVVEWYWAYAPDFPS